MTQDDSAAYAVLDRSEVLRAIFHPRAESAHVSSQTTGEEHLIEVATDTCIGARFHMCDRLGANILFFHGNGEIAADYDDLACILRWASIFWYLIIVATDGPAGIRRSAQ